MFSERELEYKPISVKEALVKMKDIAMLIVDLSLAAVIFRDKELANNVLRLSKEMDRLIYSLQISIMLTARDAEDARALQSILQVALATEKISDAASQIATPILKGLEPHPILLEGLKRLDEPIIAVEVNPKSILCKKYNDRKRLRTKLGVDIIAIRRSEKWLVDMNGVSKIMPNDTIIARGEDTGISKLKELAAGGV